MATNKKVKKSAKKSSLRKFFCSKTLNKTTNKFEFRFKEANQKDHLVFQTLEDAISHLKSLRVDATMWVKENNVFVKGIKTSIGDTPEEEVKVEIVEFTPKPKTEKPKVEIKKSETKSKPVTFKNNADLPKELFGIEIKESYSQAIFDTIIAERAAQRQGTHKVKTRAEVSGTGKKPWRQKGTGRARAGSMRSPIWVGGGRAFGPTVERNYNLKVNKKVRFLALTSALTQLALNQQVLVEEIKMEEISTKNLVKKLSSLNASELRNVLLVTNDEKVFLSGRNLKNVSIVKASSISVEQLVRTDLLIIGSEDIKYLEGLVK